MCKRAAPLVEPSDALCIDSLLFPTTSVMGSNRPCELSMIDDFPLVFLVLPPITSWLRYLAFEDNYYPIKQYIHPQYTGTLRFRQ